MSQTDVNSSINFNSVFLTMPETSSEKSRLLIVDDDKLFLDSMNTVLSSSYSIKGCAGGLEALERLSAQSYDLVILDYNMRPMNGIEILRVMREQNMDCPVIILTGYGTFEMAAEAVELEVSGILSKPVRMEQLTATIQKCLYQKHFREKIKLLNRQLNEWEVHRHIIEAQKDELDKMKSLLNITYKEIHTLFHFVHDPILVLDTNLKIVDANPAVAELMQVSHQDLRGKTYADFCLCYGLINGEELPVHKVLATGMPYECSVKDPVRGNAYYVQAYPIFDEVSGHLINVVEFRKKIASDSINPPQTNPGSLENSKLPLTREMGHEINNMLTIIRATADIMDVSLNRGNMDKAKDTLNKMNEGIDRLVRYTKNLMAKKQEENPPQRLSVVSVIRSLIDFLSPQPLFSRIEFITQFDPIIPGLMGREEQIQEIFMNLFKNAAEAMGEGYIGIMIRTLENGARVQISVSDDGPGIPTALLARLFEEPVTTKTQGNGYGLMIVKHLVEQNRGTISVQQRPDRGTRFDITFPGEM
jgi:nitrogen-specific signal transduction histidine kinase/CheY-like chemotaxis protein